MQQQLTECNDRILDLEGRLAAAGKEARSFQHKAADSERAAVTAADAAKALQSKVDVLSKQVEAATTEQHAFKDAVRAMPCRCSLLYPHV